MFSIICPSEKDSYSCYVLFQYVVRKESYTVSYCYTMSVKYDKGAIWRMLLARMLILTEYFCKVISNPI